MKNAVLLLMVLLVFAVGNAQDTHYGIRGALNISNLDFDPAPTFENKHRNGFAFAGFVEFDMSADIGLRVELQWSAEGGSDETLRADYLQLPLMLRYNVSDRLSVGAGPQLNLKVWKENDGFATFSYSGVLGIEYMFTDDLFVDARYSFGLRNVLDDEFTDFEARNHVMQFGFGIKI
jgi:hypothetical protein